MNIKKSLSSLVILTMCCIGCSNYQVKNENISSPNEATKQKTMTKVQNDMSEIVDKNYDYVLKNLGKANVTSYWIDKDKINDLQTIDDIEKLAEVNLVYLKDVTDEKENNSALYVKIKENKVKKAQIIDYYSSEELERPIKSKLLVNCYSNQDEVSLQSLNREDLQKFVGIDSNDIENIVGKKKASYDAHIFGKSEKSVSIYKLDNNDEVLAIFTENEKISKIEYFNKTNDIINKIKDIMLDNE